MDITQTFSWNVQNDLDDILTCSWNVGDGMYYWYRVESVKLPGSCYGLCPDTCFIETLNVMATSVQSLAKQLKAQRYNKKISRVHLWTRPVLECDIKHLEAAGVDLNCPTFVPVDFCIPEMKEFIGGQQEYIELELDLPGGAVPEVCTELVEELADPLNPCKPYIWFSQYNGITPSVSVGEVVIKGQIIGTIATGSPPHLDFGVSDYLNNWLQINQLFGLQTFGPPVGTISSSTCLSLDQVKRILAYVYWPVDKDWCIWVENQALEVDTKIMSWDCYSGEFVLAGGPPRSPLGANVFCAVGGSSIKSLVHSAGGDTVVIKHEDVDPICCFGDNLAEPLTSLLQMEMVHPLAPLRNLVHTPVSGLLPMSLNVEASLHQFGNGKLCYSSVSDSWQRQSHYNGWNCLLELACRTRSGSAFWHLTFRVVKDGKRSDLSIAFLPNDFRHKGKYYCEFSVKDKTVQCEVATQSVVVKDDLGIFRLPVVFKIKV